jgi:hypothetical protein
VSGLGVTKVAAFLWLYGGGEALNSRGMKGILLTIFLLLGPTIGRSQENAFLKTAPDTKNEAWWVRTEYHAFGVEVRGIPVAGIRANWCKANEFRKELFPPELASSFVDQKSPFAIDGFFDGTKTKQTALVGVYETCDGKRGTFFLILAWPTGRPPSIRFLVEIPGERGFAMVEASDASTIAVFHCMECDNVSKYRWSKSKKRFLLLPPDPDE